MQIYRDTFVEQLIVRDNKTKRILLKTGAVILAIVLILASYLFLYLVFPFFFAVIIILLFFAFKYTGLEFEYSFTNGDVDIDKIRGRRRRRNVLSTNCSLITVLAPMTEENLSRYAGSGDTVLDVSISEKSEGRWFFMTGGEEGPTRVIFNPNERLLEAFRIYLGSRMKR